MTPREIADALNEAVDEGLRLFGKAGDAQTLAKPVPDAWNAREVLGHLIDSACNNHRRFVLGQSADIRTFDGYDGEQWVARQRPGDEPWSDLVALWSAYNRHLAHVIACAPPETLQHAAESPDGSGRVTLGYLMEDYVAHMRHHYDQIQQALRA